MAEARKSKTGTAPEVVEPASESGQADTVCDATDLLERHYPSLKCVGEDWYLPKGGVYRLQNTNLVRPVALSVLSRENHSDYMAQAVMRTLESRKQVPPESILGFARFLDAERSVVQICCQNGVLRVSADDLVLEPHNIRWSFGRQVQARYDEKATCQRFQKLVREALPDREDRELFWSYCAYTLYPACDLQTFLVAYGPGGTSKSTVFEAVASALGEENVTRLGFAELCGDGPGYSLPSLQRSALNLGAEAPQGEVQESDRLKILVEGGELPVRPIYGKPRPLRGYHTKIVLLGNCQPRFKSGTSAELRRLRILCFGNEHKKTDPLLDVKLARQASGIFSRGLVPGLQTLLRSRRIPAGGPNSRRVFRQYAIVHDPHRVFVEQCCDLGPELQEPKLKLLGAWRAFVEREHLREALRDQHWFFRVLYDRYPQIQSRRLCGEENRLYVVQGIGLRPDVEVEPDILSDHDR